MEYRIGQMVLNIKDIGKIIMHMEKEFFIMLVGMYLRVNGLMTKLPDLEFINILMDQNIKEIG